MVYVSKVCAVDFFIRSSKPPSDDSLWNMLNEKTLLHLAIDNQATQIFKYSRDWTRNRYQMLAVSNRHAEFTNNLASVVETVDVLVLPLDWNDHPLGYHEIVQKNLNHEDLPYFPVKQTGSMSYAMVKASEATCWIDPMNPQALDRPIYIKNDDDVYSPLNKEMFYYTEIGRTARTALLSGFFANLCIARTDKGAQKRGVGTLVDPLYIYDLTGKAYDRSRALCELSRHATVTEPGQINYVLNVYNKPQP